jgi:squalene-hopene/tetraprenyl-beta-curcumene cyclase
MNICPEASQDSCRIEEAYAKLRKQLFAMQNADGFWTGKLSNSALSTATAVSALSVQKRFVPSLANESQSLIDRGCDYLRAAQNLDGGFGDTDRSYSNIATTYLAMAAWHLAEKQNQFSAELMEANRYIEQAGGWDGLRKRYGKDKTFVVPILSNCALAGLIPWSHVSALPFEAAALPQSWYRFAKMPVVSYAVPALVAIGQARFFHAPPQNPFTRLIRNLVVNRTRRVLRSMQPQSGGYLEATPLTSFVLMNLASIGQADSQVAMECRKFLIDSVQADGSWPIDTNLATWVTSLAIHGLSKNGCDKLEKKTIRWLLDCQHRQRHPFTGAEPGGWGWTNLSGAVPDSDDTPAAMIALHEWLEIQPENSSNVPRDEIQTAVIQGVEWLLKLQNRDGGWPTFCRGWGQLPFDRSGADLTAHAIRALIRWQPEMNSQARTIERALDRGIHFLIRHQRSDGSWLPLWFGNQDRNDDENPYYGTGKVLLALGEIGRSPARRDLGQDPVWSAAERGMQFLLRCQNHDGGWGGGASIAYPSHKHSCSSTIEETSVVMEAMATCKSWLESCDATTIEPAMRRGVDWLVDRIEKEDCRVSQPIGFYFAKLWYHEELYPYVFAAAALKRWIAEKTHAG